MHLRRFRCMKYVACDCHCHVTRDLISDLMTWHSAANHGVQMSLERRRPTECYKVNVTTGLSPHQGNYLDVEAMLYSLSGL